MTTVDYDTIDAAKAKELAANPAEMERLLCAYMEQLVIDLQADGVPGEVEVRPMSHSRDAYGVIATDVDRKVVYRATFDHETCRLDCQASCLRHTGWCCCMPLLIAKAICTLFNRWQADRRIDHPSRQRSL